MGQALAHLEFKRRLGGLPLHFAIATEEQDA
jgi:hypothetical protein